MYIYFTRKQTPNFPLCILGFKHSGLNPSPSSKVTALDYFLILGVRLVGSSYNAGRVEVYYEGIWGTVCDDNWDINDARVVCKHLGFPYAIDAYQDTRYGEGTGPILLDDVDCSGNELSLFLCRHKGVGNHNCRHSEDASVRCGNTRGENN